MPRSTPPLRNPAGPALAMLEVGDLPRGLRALDALAKEAPVDVVAAGTVQPGHYLVAFCGEVEAVERAFARALDVARGAVVDRVLLPDAEPRIVPAFADGAVRWPCPGDTLGALELPSSPTLLAAVEAALKGALVDLVELRLADGLGGKSTATLWGAVHDVEAAVDLAVRAVERQVERGCRGAVAPVVTLVPNADAAVHRAVGGGSRFFGGWRG